MYPQKFSSSLQALNLVALVVVLLLLFVLLGPNNINSSKASQQEKASEQEIESVPPGQEKKFFNMVPANLPLKFKVKNVNSKKWVHDIEVEVTNTSKRPIYFLDFYITLPEIKAPVHKIGFWLRYGRAELVDFRTPLQPDDVPLQPGEKYTFKIPESSAKGWDYLREKEGKPEPTKILLEFQGLNFGDGTGFSDSGGTPVNIHRKINFNKTCVPPPNPPPHIAQTRFSFLPASLLPVKLSFAETFNLLPGESPRVPDFCCSLSFCNYVKLGSYVCGRTCLRIPIGLLQYSLAALTLLVHAGSLEP